MSTVSKVSLISLETLSHLQWRGLLVCLSDSLSKVLVSSKPNTNQWIIKPCVNGRNIVGQQHCNMLHVASVWTPCCMLLGVIEQSLKPAKLIASCKRTQQLPTMLRCVRLHGAVNSRMNFCWYKLTPAQLISIHKLLMLIFVDCFNDQLFAWDQYEIDSDSPSTRHSKRPADSNYFPFQFL